MTGFDRAARRARRLQEAAAVRRATTNRRLERVLRACTGEELRRVQDLLAVDPAQAQALVDSLAGRSADGELGAAVAAEARRRDPRRSHAPSVWDGLSIGETKELLDLLRTGREDAQGAVDLATLPAPARHQAGRLVRRAELRLLLHIDESRACRRGQSDCDCVVAALDRLDQVPELRALSSAGVRILARRLHRSRRRGRAQ